jgi:hypothetical protein
LAQRPDGVPLVRQIARPINRDIHIPYVQGLYITKPKNVTDATTQINQQTENTQQRTSVTG